MLTHAKHMFRHLFLALAIVLTLGLAANVDASNVLYEGFDYGSTAEVLAGNGGDSTGFTSAETWGGETTTWYDPTDHGPLGESSTSGGSAALNGIAGGTETITRGIDASVAAGTTIFGGYIFRDRSGTGSPTNAINFANGSAAIQFGVTNVAFNNTDVAFHPVLAGGTSFSVDRASFNPTTNENYTVLFEVTNVNGVSGGTTLNVWALNEAQLDSVLLDDSITAAELNALAIGDAANQISQRGSNSSASAVTFATDHILNMLHRTGNTSTQANTSLDEITLSDSSLNDVLGVTVIPAPAALPAGLVMLAIMGGTRRRRR